MKIVFSTDTIKCRSFRMVLIYIVIIFSGMLPDETIAQRLVQDTLFIPIEALTLPDSVSFQIDSIRDERSYPPTVLGLHEKNAYWFVPVDLLIATHHEFATSLFRNSSAENEGDSTVSFELIVHEFRLNQKGKGFFCPDYQLNTRVSLLQKSGTPQSTYIGQFFHEITGSKPFRGGKLEKSYSKLIQQWQQEFSSDLEKTAEALRTNQTVMLTHFRNTSHAPKAVNLLAGSDLIVTPAGYLVDGEIIFSERESLKKFKRSGYNLRFRHTKDFESIEFGNAIDYFFLRYQPNIMFNLKSQLMFGFNRWDDFETADHKIWDALIINYSLSQKIIYNPLDRQSLTFGAGLFEDLYYIYSKNVRFQPGVIFYLGVKL